MNNQKHIQNFHKAGHAAQGLSAQLHAAFANPTAHPLTVAIAVTVLAGAGALILSLLGRAAMATTRVPVRGTHGGGGNGGILTFAAPRVGVLVAIAFLPSVLFGGTLDSARQAVSQILGIS